MTEVAKIEEEVQATSLMEIISRASRDPNTDVEKLERVMALYERITSHTAEQAFNTSMKAAQEEMGQISTDMYNDQTKSKYASYAAMDRALRPIYTKHGFSVSFDEGDTDKPDHIRVLAYVAHDGGFTRTYRKDMPADGKGAKGGNAMTLTHASGAADTYGMRYLLKKIFNVAVGEDDNDGNTVQLISADQKERIIALMKETNTETTPFLKYLKVSALDELPAIKFQGAISALNEKKVRS
jgi:hypothetical protein